MQTDVHLPYATVREAVLFSAQMRFPRGVPRITMEAFTDEASLSAANAGFAADTPSITQRS